MYAKSKSYSSRSLHRPNRPSFRSAFHSGAPNRNHRRHSNIGRQTIHPSRFIKAAKPTSDAVAFVPTHRFSDFVLHDNLQKNIARHDYELPTPIQDQAIPLGLAGQDVVGIANTGTGKTAAFVIPLLNQLQTDRSATALIIAPTRELAQQIYEECRIFARDSGLHGALLIGGTSMPAQIRDLKFRPRVIIGTPGRLKDHTKRGTLDLSRCRQVVLDEVDRMVDMGFIDDIRFLLSLLPKERQSYFFSATLDPKLRSLVDSFLKSPVTISVKTGETSDFVDQNVLRFTSSADKMAILQDTLKQPATQKTLIFEQTQRSVERLSQELQACGFKADAIHGGKNQSQRSRALARFKRSEVDVLVATDVAARGIDIVDITHVINYTVPKTYDDYIHRIGRAGRAGRGGQALTFVNN